MKNAGFTEVQLGFESVSSDIQRRSSSKVTSEELKEKIKILKNAGYDPMDIGVYVLMGLPDQSIEEIIQTFIFVHECGGKIKVSQYSPIPGTVDYERSVKEYGFDTDDPLYHNKSTAPLKNPKIPYNKFKFMAKSKKSISLT